ncbi:hypothetical protein CHS0354_024173 [Potamilus streckersoni]|uniref:YHYH domain-containing protein n=1 Tax=Potamilus streckersoni TaxID=2493646 RepID=A0AAE0S033_9BIVA|nr:hypothetical protein CHS0354_024173 [Potamilus streckersoni]
MMVGITNWQQQVPVPHSFTGSNAWSVPLQPTFETTPKSAVAIAANGIPIFNPLNNRGEDAKIIGELDNWGGHCGKADDYHYHVAPLHLSSTAYPHFPIAIALDGFAIYGSTEPDGTSVQPLDENNGHIYKNSYHYHGINSYPYIMGSMRGKVATDPSTTAPENQITPQPSFSPVREAQSPLNGASIADFSALSTRSYKLTYQLSGNNGYVEYSWDETEKNFTYKLTSPSGAVTNNTYTRK